MEEIMLQAERFEKEYDWLGAAKSYEKVITLLPRDDFSKMGEIHERLGQALYRFAFQAENNNDFKERLRQSTIVYEKAIEFYEKLNEPVRAPRKSRCNAMAAYIGYWLAPEAKEKKEKIDECWKLTKDTLGVLREAGEGQEYGRTYNQLSSSIVFGFCLEWDFQAREKLMKEAVEYGEQAIKSLSAFEDSRELARVYAKTAFFLGVFDYYFLDLNMEHRDSEKIQHYWQKAKELSEDMALSEFLYPLIGAHYLSWGEGTEEALTNLNKAVEYGKRTRDRFITGCAFDWLTYHKNWQISEGLDENPEERSTRRETQLRCGKEALQQYAPLSFISPRGDALWIEAFHVYYVLGLSLEEMDLEKRRNLREKAREALPDVLRRAEASGYPEIIGYAHQFFGWGLMLRAEVETNPEARRKFLEEAMEHQQEATRRVDKFHPFQSWDRGIMQMIPARPESQLADLAQNPEIRKNMLLKALAHLENGTKLCIEQTHARVFEKQAPAGFRTIGNTQYFIGVLLNRLYEVTRNEEHLIKAAKAFAEAVESFGKVDARLGITESLWKAALTYDALSEHLKAAEYFDLASTNYRTMAERVSQIRDFYLEHASYMAAWSEIEKARHHHGRQEYRLAKERFEKAAHLHKSLKKWGHLESNYSAWAQVENAEELSRNEQCEEASKAFDQASTLFGETEKSLQRQLSKIEDKEEERMTNGLIKASELRREYCEGRIAVEEAKMLDRTGDHLASSRKYGSAAEIFEKISQNLESGQERKEFKSFATLSRAWQKMMLGDARASTVSYLEASALFEQTSRESHSETLGLLSLGHSHFCKALEAGTKYADTRDPAMHVAAVQQLASASNYYIKAGFLSASEYAKATKLLFDAYVYMDNAEKESDPDKKAKLYAMIEKILQTSAGFYTKAEHPEKREQVLKLLTGVKEERELATSLIEAMHTPPIISSTEALNAPTPTQEKAVGSERFEHADVQANLLVRQKELTVGESLEVGIEFVNAGKGAALLVKFTDVIPEGFEIVEKPEKCRVEDSYIDMKGRRLDTLKTGELRLILKPKAQGTFTLKPTVLYLDENGKYKSHEPEPVTITVKELGIRGWLKGER